MKLFGNVFATTTIATTTLNDLVVKLEKAKQMLAEVSVSEKPTVNSIPTEVKPPYVGNNSTSDQLASAGEIVLPRDPGLVSGAWHQFKSWFGF